jgi:hypothetical protein
MLFSLFGVLLAGEGSGVPEPCADWGLPVAGAAVQSAALNEISGIAPSRKHPGIAWVIEDSGNRAVVYALELATGATVAKVHLRGSMNVDWEEVRLAPCEPGSDRSCIWVAETGDNARIRSDVALLRLEEPDELSARSCLKAERFPVRYPDGPQDVEALYFGEDGLARLVSKLRDGSAVVYRSAGLENALLEQEASRVVTLDGQLRPPAEGPLPYRVTAADAVAGQVFLRTYETTFLVAGDQQCAIPSPVEAQGEALALDPRDGALWWVSEGERPVLYRAERRFP